MSAFLKSAFCYLDVGDVGIEVSLQEDMGCINVPVNASALTLENAYAILHPKCSALLQDELFMFINSALLKKYK